MLLVEEVATSRGQVAPQDSQLLGQSMCQTIPNKFWLGEVRYIGPPDTHSGDGNWLKVILSRFIKHQGLENVIFDLAVDKEKTNDIQLESR